MRKEYRHTGRAMGNVTGFYTYYLKSTVMFLAVFLFLLITNNQGHGLFLADWALIFLFVAISLFFVHYFLKYSRVASQAVLCLLWVGLILTAVNIFFKVFCAPFFDWNAHRLAWVFSEKYGYDLYYGHGFGPLLARMYGPIFPFMYYVVTLFRDPTAAIVAGSALTTSFFFLPAFFVFIKFYPYKEDKNFLLFGMFLFISLTFLTRGLFVAAFQVHADAPAMFWACLAALWLLFYKDKQQLRFLFLSAFSVSLSIWTKQVMVPLIVVLPLWVFLKHGKRVFKQYAALLCVAVIGLFFLFIFVYKFDRLFFNIFLVPSRQSCWVSEGWLFGMPWAISQFLQQCVFQLILLFFLRRNVSQCVRCVNPRFENISLFFLLGVFFLPGSLIFFLKQWADVNAFAPSLYFFLLSTTLLLLEKMREESFFSWCQKTSQQFSLFLFTFLFIGLIMNYSFFCWEQLKTFSSNPQKVAYQYMKKNPYKGYFPDQTLSSLMATGKLFHSADGLIDLSTARIPISKEQLCAYLPVDMEFIALNILYPGRGKKVLEYFPEFSRKKIVAELPFWMIYERQDKSEE